MAFIEENVIVMLLDYTELRKIDSILLRREDSLMKLKNSYRERNEYMEECINASKKVENLLDKCRGFNENSKQESNSSEAYIPDEDASDPVNYAINIAMEHVRDWCNKMGWDGLLEYLENESKDASHKFINLMRKYNNSYNHKRDNTYQGINLAEKAKIAEDIQDYVKFAINISLQFVRNCSLRKQWVSKIEAHFDILVQAFNELNVDKRTNVYDMTEHVSLCKKCMFEFGKNCGNGRAPFKPMAYLKLLNKEEIELTDMVERKKIELGYTGKFDNLTESQQLEVCRGIFKESGTKLVRSKSRSKSKSSIISSLALLDELIFDDPRRNIRSLTESTFHGLEMPNGMAIAWELHYKNTNENKIG